MIKKRDIDLNDMMCNLALRNDVLALFEYITEKDEEGNLKVNIDAIDQISFVENKKWMQSLKKSDPEKFGKESYFTLFNEMRNPIKKGSQVHLCYGKRTN